MTSVDRPRLRPDSQLRAAAVNCGREPVRLEHLESVPEEVRSLLRALDTDYGFGLGRLAHRASALTLPLADGEPALALTIDAAQGFPFLLAVASIGPPSAKHRDVAVRHALGTSTIDVVLLYDQSSGLREVLRRNFREERFDATSCQPSYRVLGQLHLFDECDRGPGRLRTSRVPSTKKLESIFFDMHSTMRDEDGLHADEALEELCKLLHLKALADEGSNLRVDINAPYSAEEKAALLRGLYMQSSETNVQEQRDRRAPFCKPIALSTTALVKAFGFLEHYTLTGTPADIRGRAFQKLLSKAARASMGQYFTPTQVVSMMVDIMDLEPTDSIMDPFCGSGHFLMQSFRRLTEKAGSTATAGGMDGRHQLHGIEKSERVAHIAVTDLSLNGCSAHNIRTADALLDFDSYHDIHESSFDVVLTNPPFGSILGVQAFNSLANFSLAKGRKRLPLEVAGLERCAELLKPGGRLAIVLPESLFSAASFRYVRAWLQRVFSVRIVVDLPQETFCPFGANVRSGVLFARKRELGEQASRGEKVNMIRMDNIGYDAAGRTMAASDVEPVVEEGRRFLAAEGW